MSVKSVNTDDPDGSAELGRELARLRAMEREYNVTVRALAITVEELLKFTGGDSVEIGDVAIEHAPDLTAWRDVNRRLVGITVTRGSEPHGPDRAGRQPTTINGGPVGITIVDGPVGITIVDGPVGPAKAGPADRPVAAGVQPGDSGAADDGGPAVGGPVLDRT